MSSTETQPLALIKRITVLTRFADKAMAELLLIHTKYVEMAEVSIAKCKHIPNDPAVIAWRTDLEMQKEHVAELRVQHAKLMAEVRDKGVGPERKK